MFPKSAVALMGVFAVLFSVVLAVYKPFNINDHCPVGSLHIGRRDNSRDGPPAHCIDRSSVISYETFEIPKYRVGYEGLAPINITRWTVQQPKLDHPPFERINGDMSWGNWFGWGHMLYHDLGHDRPAPNSVVLSVHHLKLVSPRFCVSFSYILHSNYLELKKDYRPQVKLHMDYVNGTKRVSELLWECGERDLVNDSNELHTWYKKKVTRTVEKSIVDNGGLQFRFEAIPSMMGLKRLQIGAALDEVFLSANEEGVTSYCDM